MPYKTNGSAQFKDLEALFRWFSGLSLEEGEALKKHILIERLQLLALSRNDHIQNAIDEMFSVAIWGVIHENPSDRWEAKKQQYIDKIRKFSSYCEQFSQTPRVGFWADGLCAFLYLGNSKSGIVIPNPEKYLEFLPEKDYSDLTPLQLRGKLGIADAPESGTIQALVPADAQANLTGSMLQDRLAQQKEALASLEQEMQDVQQARTGELAKLREEMERIQAELEARKKNLMQQLQQKMNDLTQMKEQMENQIYLLDAQIYAIRCFAGEVVQFAHIRTGRNAPAEEPVVIHQKLRYLDEDLGRLASLYEIQWEDLSMFEEFLRFSPLALDAFAPNERCIVLVRLSRTGIQQGRSNDFPYSNLLKHYEYYHGKTVGIIIRNGENVYLGWTDEDRIHIQDDLLISRVVTEIVPVNADDFSETQSEAEQKRERKRLLDGLVSRSFVYNILQGVVEHTSMLPLPHGVTLQKPSPYVVFSVADKWLTDNRFGSFQDIINRVNEDVREGDMLLTVQGLVPERSGWYGNYSPRWDNVRGRGDRNRTHDCQVSDCHLYKANLVEYDDPVTMLRYRFDGNEFVVQKKNSNLDDRAEIIEEFERRDRHVFVSVPKMWSDSGARSNFELNSYEYINLTFLNSVWLEWCITTKNLGGWSVGGKEVNYSYAIRYLKTALEFIRKREAAESACICAINPEICNDPDWPVRLSTWKMQHSVRNITPYQAKRFIKYCLADTERKKVD